MSENRVLRGIFGPKRDEVTGEWRKLHNEELNDLYCSPNIVRRIILPVVLYGCETWLLTLRKERRLRVFENRVLRRIFGPKRDEVTGKWRKLHSEELNDLYCSPNIVRRIILPVVLCGCETWLLTLREERKLGLFENRVLRRIFGPKRDEVTGEWRKLHSEELNDLHCSPNIVWVIK